MLFILHAVRRCYFGAIYSAYVIALASSYTHRSGVDILFFKHLVWRFIHYGARSNDTEIERYESKFIPPVRTASKITSQIGAIRIPEHWGPKSIALAAILPLLSILFRPVIYKFMLRLRLYLLKFTSHFVALAHYSNFFDNKSTLTR